MKRLDVGRSSEKRFLDTEREFAWSPGVGQIDAEQPELHELKRKVGGVGESDRPFGGGVSVVGDLLNRSPSRKLIPDSGPGGIQPNRQMPGGLDGHQEQLVRQAPMQMRLRQKATGDLAGDSGRRHHRVAYPCE